VLPLHEGATSQEVAGKLAGTKHCAVGLARIQPSGGSEIDVHPDAEQVFYVLQGTLSLRNREQGEIMARPGERSTSPPAILTPPEIPARRRRSAWW